ncbi:VCBS repeat-containing protein [Paenibacillus sp. J2TS4]|uniref:FG-GAP repeat domain-containing protein n=1 Tax=Paenibacillus sp. J2TS4 TaxID=2807194 RepID=UPI001B2B0A6F|nr:VCBS repeat-containing protein [Paenibacillus sp. J2TS4]GIP35646.1 hypothetical protein J2TS4_48560 [Paenibacillus sp. J2TS4]
MKLTKRMIFIVGSVLIVLIAALFFIPKVEQVNMLYATDGDNMDLSAWGNFEQALAANIHLERRNLADLSLNRLTKFDAVYLDIHLQNSDSLQAKKEELIEYVRQGGHLYLENGFASEFPPEFLGAEQLVELPANSQPQFEYPEVDPHLSGMQTVFRSFADNFLNHAGMDRLPGFDWGQGMIPTTAKPIVSLNQVPIMTIHEVEQGSVLLTSTFLPNRYFITGFDLQSGMDPAAGFQQLAAPYNELPPEKGTAYFNRYRLAVEPYFQFSFAAANYQLRGEFLSYLSKEKYGYSITKVLGPYGRPAMAFQNHYEALPAFRDLEAIQWTEMLKEYQMIPSFSIVRGSYDWGQWWESINIHLNTGSQEKPEFVGEYVNSFYGSGAKLVSEGQPLKLAQYPKYVQLSEPIELPYRAYPAFADVSGSGRADLLVGSADGFIYLLRNEGMNPDAYANQPLPPGLEPPAAFGAPEPLLTPEGEPLRVSGYAAIAAADVTGSGRADLLIGDEHGAVFVSLNQGNGTFAPPTPLIAGGEPLAVASFAAPAWGDVDGDGVPDLVVGDGNGDVRRYRGIAGEPLRFEAGERLVSAAGQFAAPALRDMSGDGRLDLLVGSNEGDIQLYVQEETGWSAKGPLVGDKLNPAGNHALVGGHNSVPLWYDINGDGKDDLLVGQVEFGIPVTIDDPDFPYADELQQFLQYARDHHLELYPHVFVHNFVSDEQEKLELELHRKAFDKLGIPWKDPGTNQHTWRISHPERLQTLRNENAQSIWFNFGFRPSYTLSDPRSYLDYMWGTPFMLMDEELQNPMVLFAPSPIYDNSTTSSTLDIYDSIIRLDMPINYMEHIEYFKGKKASFEKFVRYFDQVRTEHDYNFVTEPQMARSFLTTLSAKVEVRQSWGMYWVDRIKDKLGRGIHRTLTLSADTKEIPTQAGAYRETLGVRIEPGQPLAGHPLTVDSDLFVKQEDVLYTGLAKPTQLTVSWATEPIHLIRSNVPVRIVKGDKQWKIELLEAGMQQIKLFSPFPVQIEGSDRTNEDGQADGPGGNDLEIEEDKEAQTYTVTHYGDTAEIIVRWE